MISKEKCFVVVWLYRVLEGAHHAVLAKCDKGLGLFLHSVWE